MTDRPIRKIDRITIINPSLGMGGAERVLLALADHFTREGREVVIVTYDDLISDWFPIPRGVRRVALKWGRSSFRIAMWWHNLNLARQIRKVVRSANPDVVVAFQTWNAILVLFALQGRAVPIVVSEHVDLRWSSPSRLTMHMRRLTYRRAACVHAVSEELADAISTSLDHPCVTAIHNPIALPPSTASADSRIVVGVGRLDHQKRFDILIRAFSLTVARIDGWTLNIVGDGPLYSDLVDLSRQLGIEKRVQFLGAVGNVGDVYQSAEMFVLSSDYEGFGMVLAEAMSYGLPVVTTDCPSGPREIIEGGAAGILVPVGDPEALADGMTELMASPEMRREMGRKALERSQTFSVELVGSQWLDFLDRVGSSGV